MLSLSFPGGPIISKMAEQGNPTAISLTAPMLHSKDDDFSFSGLKTEVLYYIRDHKVQKGSQTMKDLCAAFQSTVVKVLVKKTLKVAKEYDAQSVLLAGGVAANKLLRETLEKEIEDQLADVVFKTPDFEYCTDNAATIGAAALLAGKPAKSVFEVHADPNWEL